MIWGRRRHHFQRFGGPVAWKFSVQPGWARTWCLCNPAWTGQDGSLDTVLKRVRPQEAGEPLEPLRVRPAEKLDEPEAEVFIFRKCQIVV